MNSDDMANAIDADGAARRLKNFSPSPLRRLWLNVAVLWTRWRNAVECAAFMRAYTVALSTDARLMAELRAELDDEKRRANGLQLNCNMKDAELAILRQSVELLAAVNERNIQRIQAETAAARSMQQVEMARQQAAPFE